MSYCLHPSWGQRSLTCFQSRYNLFPFFTSIDPGDLTTIISSGSSWNGSFISMEGRWYLAFGFQAFVFSIIQQEHNEGQTRVWKRTTKEGKHSQSLCVLKNPLSNPPENFVIAPNSMNLDQDDQHEKNTTGIRGGMFNPTKHHPVVLG